MSTVAIFSRKINTLYKKSPNILEVFFINIENLTTLILAYGHKQTIEIINNIATELDGLVIMSDQIIIPTTQKTKSEITKFIKYINKLLHNEKNHIAATITHKRFSKKLSADEILSKTYSYSRQEKNLFSTDITDKTNESKLQIKLSSQIKQAIKLDKLRLAYQPIIDSNTGKITHHEALLRIIAEDGRLESAGSFIPIAEKMGLIDFVDIKVLNMVIDALKQDPQRSLAFNISNLTISNRKWIKHFFDNITSDIGKRMIIEITETTAAKDLRETAYFIATLQDAGCKFALDDFGSGYTSFRQIRTLSFDYVKIDGSIIQDIATNSESRLLLESLLQYLQGLNVKTVAEFVENGETAKILMELGVNYLQGNYFGSAA